MMAADNQGAGGGWRKWRKIVIGGLTGMLVGFLGATVVMRMTDGGGFLEHISKSQIIALLVALVYLLSGLLVVFGIVNPKVGAQIMNVEDVDEILEQRASLVPSAIGIIVLAGALIALALGAAPGVPGGLIPPMAALVAFVVLMALAAWFSMAVVRNSDELMRAVMNESAAVAYYLIFLVVGGWAVLAHLGFVSAPAMLDIVIIFYVVILAASFWVIGRRGMIAR